MNNNLEKVVHPIPPVYNNESKILILGSLPSVKSRELGYQYAHPQNRFWKVIEILFEVKINDKNRKQFLLDNKIALWDVIKSCKIKGSSDSSITDVIANDIDKIIKESKIKKIFTTGKKAYELYQKYVYPKTQVKAICLSSTSPANAIKSLDDLVLEYQIIKKHL